MTTAELLKEIQKSIVYDKTIDAWCKFTFDSYPTCYLGIDEQNPPVLDDYPIIAIVGVTQNRSDSTRELSWDIDLGVGIISEAVTEVEGSKTYEGFLLAEELREKAENAILCLKPARISATGEAGTISYHPLYVSYSTINVKLKRGSQESLP
ncbi:MAG: hypothetical protein KJ737_26025 [Proteobacteria bacterium]|nr:hypothetical protein [Pseudomonadota bacterium]